MSTITIPKKMVSKDDLIIIPRKEYETLLRLSKIREFTPTPTEKRALAAARRRFAKGEYLTLEELRNELALGH
ncbi:MAG: hypothetical protein G01um101470_782 [Parcubacteria group bacterium Gr01-1014_70]|nr:MAG: hypothetical protein G01um101470_782 [Parcubacteria group bacterium Gr01-1014_70]